MSHVVAVAQLPGGHFAFIQPSPENAGRGLETTSLLSGAERFADQAAIDSYVTARGGSPLTWVEMTVPLS